MRCLIQEACRQQTARSPGLIKLLSTHSACQNAYWDLSEVLPNKVLIWPLLTNAELLQNIRPRTHRKVYLKHNAAPQPQLPRHQTIMVCSADGTVAALCATRTSTITICFCSPTPRQCWPAPSWGLQAGPEGSLSPATTFPETTPGPGATFPEVTLCPLGKGSPEQPAGSSWSCPGAHSLHPTYSLSCS